MSKPTVTRRERRVPLLAASCFVLLAVFAAAFDRTAAGIATDRSVLHAVSRPVGTASWRMADEFNDRIPDIVAIGCLLAFVNGLLTGTMRPLLAVAGSVLIAVAVSEALKHAHVVVLPSHVPDHLMKS